jgi:hypothetical protein
MKFYKYWAQAEAAVDAARPWKLRAYGGSNHDLDDARRRAQEVAERAAAAIARGKSLRTYGYSDRPLREEIIEEFRDESGVIAAITRNSYGSLILNTSRVMFVDVDRPPSGVAQLGKALRDLWSRLTGNAAVPAQNGDATFLDRFTQVVDARPGLGARVYRTAGGFRLLITSRTFDPVASESADLLAAFGGDPLYTRLCKAQQCFRARLSAKFWRCGAQRPPSHFPWFDPEKERIYRQWEQAYHSRANQCAVCEVVKDVGESTIDRPVQTILNIHDRLTIRGDAKLA